MTARHCPNRRFFARSWLIMPLVVVAWGLVTGVSDAQTPRGRSGRSSYRNRLARPVVSPYINLSRPFGDPAVDYFTLSRPPLDLQAGQFRQQQNLQNLRQEVDAEVLGGVGRGQRMLPQTGHAAGYLIYSHYYTNLQGAPQGMGGQGMGGQGGGGRAARR